MIKKVRNEIKNLLNELITMIIAKDVTDADVIDLLGDHLSEESTIQITEALRRIGVVKTEEKTIEMTGGSEAYVDSMRKYIQDISKYDLLSANSEKALKRKIETGDEEARSLMINSNLRLVVSIAKKHYFNNKGINMLDLIQEGNLGLMKAVEKFDPDRGNRFSTYATYWIRQSIKKYINDHNRSIRIPAHMKNRIYRVNRVKLEFEEKYNRLPTMAELMKETGFSEEELSRIEVNSQGISSLDKNLSEDGEGATLESIIENIDAANPLEEAIKDEVVEIIREQLKKALTEREYIVIVSRAGIGIDRKMTLEDIGNELTITRERVRQIEKEAREKLRKNPDIVYLFNTHKTN